MNSETEKHWEMAMDTTIRMKFENLKRLHLREMQDIMAELNAERKFRLEQCKKLFKQWYENLSVECILNVSNKIPVKVLQEEDKLPRRMRSQGSVISSETEEEDVFTCNVIT